VTGLRFVGLVSFAVSVQDIVSLLNVIVMVSWIAPTAPMNTTVTLVSCVFVKNCLCCFVIMLRLLLLLLLFIMHNAAKIKRGTIKNTKTDDKKRLTLKHAE